MNIPHLKKIVLTVIVTLAFVSVKSQNDPLINHFMYHEHVYNPANAGNTKTINVGLLARQQWVGFKGSPSTQLLNTNAYIDKLKGGVGMVLINDMLGNEKSFTARLSYAYRQRVGDDMYLSAGISAGIVNRAVNGNNLSLVDDGDQNAINAAENFIKPDLGFGLEFSGKGFIVGASATHINKSLKNATVFNVPRHFFAYTKYNWSINNKTQLQPALFIRSSAFITQADIAVNATFNKRLTVGTFYRTTDDIGMLLGVHFGKFMVSYSFDFDFGTLSSNQSGSHELTLIGTFSTKKPKTTIIKSPRIIN